MQPVIALIFSSCALLSVPFAPGMFGSSAQKIFIDGECDQRLMQDLRILLVCRERTETEKRDKERGELVDILLC